MRGLPSRRKGSLLGVKAHTWLGELIIGGEGSQSAHFDINALPPHISIPLFT